jgi:hypothetical protein
MKPKTLQEGRNTGQMVNDYAKYTRGEISYDQLHSNISKSMNFDKYKIDNLITPTQVALNIHKQQNQKFEITDNQKKDVEKQVKTIIDYINTSLGSATHLPKCIAEFSTTSNQGDVEYFQFTQINRYFEQEWLKAIKQFTDAGWYVAYQIYDTDTILFYVQADQFPWINRKIFKNGWKYL